MCIKVSADSAQGPKQWALCPYPSTAMTVMILMADGGQITGVRLCVNIWYHANLVIRRSLSVADSGDSMTICGGSGMPVRFTRCSNASMASRSGVPPWLCLCWSYNGPKDFITRMGTEVWSLLRTVDGMLEPSPVPNPRFSRRSTMLVVNKRDTDICKLPAKLNVIRLVMVLRRTAT